MHSGKFARKYVWKAVAIFFDKMGRIRFEAHQTETGHRGKSSSNKKHSVLSRLPHKPRSGKFAWLTFAVRIELQITPSLHAQLDQGARERSVDRSQFFVREFFA